MPSSSPSQWDTATAAEGNNISADDAIKLVRFAHVRTGLTYSIALYSRVFEFSAAGKCEDELLVCFGPLRTPHRAVQGLGFFRQRRADARRLPQRDTRRTGAVGVAERSTPLTGNSLNA